MAKFFIVGHKYEEYAHLFEQMGMDQTIQFNEADLFVFTGGEDVSPGLYNHIPHHTTHSNSYRDVKEAGYFDIAEETGIAMVGICRGAQFLNVMNGGTMYQNVSMHTREHPLIIDEDGTTIMVSSTHHQMMKPAENAIILATANEKGHREWWNPEADKFESAYFPTDDVEVVLYESSKSLCFQPHPEFIGERYAEMKNYFTALLSDNLGLDVQSPQVWN